MSAPNLFLVYVNDTERSTAFYADLFDMKPIMVTPRYVPFEVAPGVVFALWSGKSDQVAPGTPRTSEIGLMLPGPASAIDDVHAAWTAKGATVIEPPHDEVFGRTFVVADPDGNLIRVAPVD
ncbi:MULTISPECIES: VOC family protein [unclassified Streptomyces]|uniref:VOC family protein n=1 Tax=unclassified Streptomyces TaxID=2593676 RepID=UPI0030773FA3